MPSRIVDRLRTLFSRSRPAEPWPTGAIAEIPVVDDAAATSGLGRITVHAHEIRTPTVALEAWTYLSDGLGRLGQHELALTLSRSGRERPDDYPRAGPMAFFKAHWDRARAGRPYDAFQWCQWTDAPGDLPEVAGLVLVPPVSVPGMTFPDGTLSGVLLHEDERLVIETQKMPGRVLTQLGARYGFFPYAFWYDRDRRSVFTRAMLQQSFLETHRTTFVRMPGLYVTKDDGGRIVLRIDAINKQSVARAMPTLATADGYVVVFPAGIDPRADALLWWDSTSSEPSAICTEEARGGVVRRMGGAFLMIASSRESVETLRVVEDGFALLVGLETGRAVLDALASGAPSTLPASGDRPPLVIEWNG